MVEFSSKTRENINTLIGDEVSIHNKCILDEKQEKKQRELHHISASKLNIWNYDPYRKYEWAETTISAFDHLMLCDVSCTIFHSTNYIPCIGALLDTCWYVFHYFGITFDRVYVRTVHGLMSVYE